MGNGAIAFDTLCTQPLPLLPCAGTPLCRFMLANGEEFVGWVVSYMVPVLNHAAHEIGLFPKLSLNTYFMITWMFSHSAVAMFSS